MDKLRSIQTFIAIAERGSLTAAAEALDTSLPTVVRKLAELEANLGVRLFNRTTRRIHLTDEGHRYLAICKTTLGQLEEAEEALFDAKAKPSGKLVLTAPVLFGRLHVAPLVAEFMRMHPALSVEMLLLDRSIDLIEEGVDLAVRIGHLADSTLHAVQAGELQRVFCASPAYLKQHGVPKHPDELSGHAGIRFTGRSVLSEWQYRENGRNLTVRFNPRLMTNSVDAAINACRDGLGIGAFLSYMVQAPVRAGELKPILRKYESEPLPIHFLYPHSKLLSARVRAFIDFAVPRLRQQDFIGF
ncbi:LysR substrate-binding domain-containing protein [Noviherbaspirillum sp. CPCC 100848]|uniref:LysR substrate-binding domain-containing protein n=1 Tax=Noviherbaspirillum album TaxID=3080276 RepID=A0ABU6JBH8_9BURK|nr:LysR substrate-binding domain-containing protein [Noviherbaspirillum sp. CPCC 100848]MEC4720612.1 LysR substrate-binding domain-containing protein [Noviherbaspirillum sp. CPCC 100848]